MSNYATSKIFVVGGTGAQGIPVVRGLVKDRKYVCRVLTRDPTSPRAKELLALGNVELVEGSFASEATLREGYRGCDGAFVNIDGFNTGEKTEMFWAIRSYELAIEEGIKFFVYGNLDFAYKKGAYDPKYRAGMFYSSLSNLDLEWFALYLYPSIFCYAGQLDWRKNNKLLTMNHSFRTLRWKG